MNSRTIYAQGRRPNVLIVGPERHAEAALEAIHLWLGPSTHTCVLPGPLHLPRAGCAAVILRNVGLLDSVQQRTLCDWLESDSQVPVVSLHPFSLFGLVVDGTFNDQLYYRLNVIVEDGENALPGSDG